MTKLVVTVLRMLLAFLSGSVLTEAGTTCPSSENADKTVHFNKNGDDRCCVTRLCPAGTEAHLCGEFDSHSTSCQPCAPGTYQSSEKWSSKMIECEPHTTCGEGALVIQNGTTTTDVKCACNLAGNYYGTWPVCHFKTCQPGYQLQIDGSCQLYPSDFSQLSDSLKPSLTSPVLVVALCQNETNGNKASKVCVEVANTNDTVMIIALVIAVVLIFSIVTFICYKRKLCAYIGCNTPSAGPSDPEKGPENEILIDQQVNGTIQQQPEIKEKLATDMSQKIFKNTVYEDSLDRSSSDNKNSVSSDMHTLQSDEFDLALRTDDYGKEFDNRQKRDI